MTVQDGDEPKQTRPAEPDRMGRATDIGTWADHVDYARTRDPDLLADLVGNYDGYVRSLAYRMHRGREPLEDLEQVAREALVAALGRFEPERGIPFAAFAKPTVLGALRRHYRDQGWALRVPRRVHELVYARQQSVDRLMPELGREPTVDEVATDLDVDAAELRSAAGAVRARATRSLDVPASPDGSTSGDAVGVDDADLRASDDRIALAGAIDGLDDKSRELLDLYYRRELTQSQIAERYGVSQMQVSRWLASIVGRLRSDMAVA